MAAIPGVLWALIAAQQRGHVGLDQRRGIAHHRADHTLGKAGVSEWLSSLKLEHQVGVPGKSGGLNEV